MAWFGARMAEPGQVTAAEEAIAEAGPLALVHGDAQTRNMRTSPDGEVALLDWEDVSAAPGVLDLAWLLMASVDPGRWDEVIAAYGAASGLNRVLPAVMVQGLFMMGGHFGRLAGVACPGEPARRGLPTSVLIGGTAALPAACARISLTCF
jgi:hypothetical protein